MKKSLFWIGCLALTLGSFSSCADDDKKDEDKEIVDPSGDGADKQGEDDQPSKKGNKEISDFLKSLKILDAKYDASAMQAYFDAIPSGIYQFEDKKTFVKCADGGAFILENLASGVGGESYMVGNSIYNMDWGYDGSTSGYMFYNDGNSEEFVPSYHQYEYLTRSEVFSNGMTDNDFLYKFFSYMEDSFCNILMAFVSYDSYEDAVLHSENVNYNGLDCKHYYITSESYEPVEILPSSSLKNSELHMADFWVTDSGVLVGIVFPKSSDLVLEKYTPVETGFAETYKKLSKQGKGMNDCIKSHKKYVNQWPTGLYPEWADSYLKKFNGKIKAYDVSYRAWIGLGGFTNVTIYGDNTTSEEALNYIAEVKKLNLCTVNEDIAEPTLQIGYEASNWDCTDAPLGETVIYPAYKIQYFPKEYESIAGFSFKISFDAARVSGV